jgi:hypothetical protein
MFEEAVDMKRTFVPIVGLSVLAALAGESRAQFLPPPTAAGVSPLATPAGVGAVAGPVAGQRTIWGFLGLSKANLASCKAKICASPLGLVMNNFMQPMGFATGGLVQGNCCPPLATPGQLDAAKAAGQNVSPAQEAAAAIAADEAAAKARVAAVEYLGTVDCHYWPEAADALVAALREDRNECVRFAAARVLGSGCCCTKKTIEALTTSVQGSEKDGNPAETSPRVKATAYAALQHCLTRYTEPTPEPEPTPTPEPVPPEPAIPVAPEGATPDAPEPGLEPEKDKEKKGATDVLPPPPLGLRLPGSRTNDAEATRRASYDARLRAKPGTQVWEEARQTVRAQAPRMQQSRNLGTGNRSVFQAFGKAVRESRSYSAEAYAAAATANLPPAGPIVPMTPAPMALQPDTSYQPALPPMPPTFEAPAPSYAPAPAPASAPVIMPPAASLPATYETQASPSYDPSVATASAVPDTYDPSSVADEATPRRPSRLLEALRQLRRRDESSPIDALPPVISETAAAPSLIDPAAAAPEMLDGSSDPAEDQPRGPRRVFQSLSRKLRGGEG